MDIQKVIQDTNYSVRTQISLSPSLYRLLKEKARKEEKPLAAIVRDNLLTHFQEDERKREASDRRIKELLERVRALNGKSGWSRVKNPHKLIRQWRREEDEKRMKRIGL